MAEEKEPRSQEPEERDSDPNPLLMRGQRILSESMAGGQSPLAPAPGSARPPMDSASEVGQAADKLTGAVDQMVHPLLLALGLLDIAIKWLKGIAACMAVAFAIAVYIAVRIEIASQDVRDASKAVAEAKAEVKQSKQELMTANAELKKIRADMLFLKADAAKQAVDQAAQPQIVPGDRPGEVSIVTPVIAPAALAKAKQEAVQAVQAGKEPPPPPRAEKATRIPAQLKPAEIREMNSAFGK